MYACTYRLLAPEESSHCTITTLLCHWAVNICSRFCLISHLFLSVHLLIIPTVHLTLLGHITPQTRKSTTFLTVNEFNFKLQKKQAALCQYGTRLASNMAATDHRRKKSKKKNQLETFMSRNLSFIVSFGGKIFVLLLKCQKRLWTELQQRTALTCCKDINRAIVSGVRSQGQLKLNSYMIHT